MWTTSYRKKYIIVIGTAFAPVKECLEWYNEVQTLN